MKSVAARSKAAYIRRRGTGASDEQRAWLDTYEATGRARAPNNSVPSSSMATGAPNTSVPSSSMGTSGGETALPMPPAPEAPLPSADPWAGFAARPLSPALGAPAAPPVALHCVVGKDCPQCRKLAGAMICSTSGAPVYPRMTDDAARGMAGTLLGALAFAARFIWKKDVFPTDAEISSLGKALQETIYQRAGVLGAEGDLFALAFVLISFGARCKNAPLLPVKADQ